MRLFRTIEVISTCTTLIASIHSFRADISVLKFDKLICVNAVNRSTGGRCRLNCHL